MAQSGMVVVRSPERIAYSTAGLPSSAKPVMALDLATFGHGKWQDRETPPQQVEALLTSLEGNSP